MLFVFLRTFTFRSNSSSGSQRCAFLFEELVAVVVIMEGCHVVGIEIGEAMVDLLVIVFIRTNLIDDIQECCIFGELPVVDGDIGSRRFAEFSNVSVFGILAFHRFDDVSVGVDG